MGINGGGEGSPSGPVAENRTCRQNLWRHPITREEYLPYTEPAPLTLRISLSIFFILLLASAGHAQDWLGYHTSTYAGINAVHINPALITGTNYKKFDLSIVAGHANVSNNHFFVNSSTITDHSLFGQPNFQNRYIRENFNGLPKSAFANVNFQAPAFLIQLTPKDAIGFSPRLRGFVNADNLDERLVKLIYEGLDFPTYWNQRIDNGYISANAHVWAEYGFTYARTIFKNDFHAFKGGISLKLIQGLASGYMTAYDASYNFYNDQVAGIYRTNIHFGMSQNVQDNRYSFDFAGGPGFGMDIGFTYEYTQGELYRNGLYRPKREVKRYGIFAADETQYKWKVGLSINDIGTVPYRKSTNSRNFYVNVDSLNLNVFDGISGVNSFNQRMRQVFGQSDDDSTYWMDLPTHINGFFDYRIGRGFAINSTVQVALQHGMIDESKNHYLYQLSFTPRWESKWFGVYMPLSFNEHLLFNWGLSLRLGPLVIGTGDLLGNLIKREYASVDVHFALRIIIPDKMPSYMKRKYKCPAYW